MKKLALLSLLFSFATYAMDVSYGMGEQSFTDDRDRLRACTIAENKAINNALLNYTGREFQSTKETLCLDTKEHAYCDYLKEIQSTTAGTVSSVVERIRRTKNNTCFVEVKVEIEKSRQLNAEVDSKRMYKSGDPLKVNIKVGEPLYLYIFNLHEKGVDLLFPNKYNTNALIDDRFEFPDKDVTITATTVVDTSNETMLYLFTKRRQEFEGRVDKDSLKEMLKSIPVFEKKLIQHNLVIRRSER